MLVLRLLLACLLPLFASAVAVLRTDDSTAAETLIDGVFEIVEERPNQAATALGLKVNFVENVAANVGGVYICTGTNWSGTCGYAVQPVNACIVLGSDCKNKIASFGPDQCTMCLAYTTTNCSFGDGFFWMFQYPGSATGGLNVANNAWNKRIGSFKCWKSPDCY
ncbi:hypothetical protein C8Q80DRAFT_1180084 [Daedaleopsis nitida]|nr:hypothetical protein C8Q80DRAFT_1180084 [Daedaleopsis nitida]